MENHRVVVRGLGRSKQKYYVLTSWRDGARRRNGSKVDLWVPELSPALRLLSQARKGRLTWEEMLELYRKQLESAKSLDYLRPLALLSKRKSLVLMCACANGRRCPNRELARSIVQCRRRNDFALDLGLSTCKREAIHR